MTDQAYHHSVRHYHSPFKMEHRNSSAFPDPRSPQQRAAHEQAFRQLELLQTYRSDAATAADPQRRAAAAADAAQQMSPYRRHRTAGERPPAPRAAVPGMMPNLLDAVNANSDHMWGAGMSPSRMSPARAEQILRETITRLDWGQPPTPAVTEHTDRSMTQQEAHTAWLEEKSLRFGVHRPRRVPYVGRDEWVDPIRNTRAGAWSACTYTSKPLPPNHPTSKFGAVRMDVPFGARRTPTHALDLPEKINWHRPFAPTTAAAERNVSHGSADADDSRLLRLPATSLLTEVEERLRLLGVGSLLDVRHASDEAISALLRDCGFSPTQRMTILWELRKRHPRVE
jgi:hypothetical protein